MISNTLNKIPFGHLLTFCFLCALLVPFPVFAVLETVGLFVLKTVGLLTGLGGTLLNFAIEELIIGMGDLLNRAGFGFSIEVAWIVVRDLMNIFFVFGLIYVGMSLILGIQKYDIKRQITFIIIGALLVNFSLFFAKFVVDVANITATEIYEELIFAEAPGFEDRINVGISGQFMSAMGISSFFDPRSGVFTDAEEYENIDLGFVLVGSLFLLVAAFVFAAAAIMIIIRFVILVFLMIFSPIAFGALAFPQTEKYAFDWWRMLFKQAFFAPALLFLLFISLQVLNGTIINKNNASFADALSNAALDGNTIVFFFIATGFMIGSLIIAKQIGAYGAKASGNVAARFTFGATGALGRNTLGRGLNNLANRNGLLDAASESGLRGFTARRALSLTRFGASASYDARSIADKTGLTKDLEGRGVSLGNRFKGGYEKRQKDIVSSETKFAESLGKNQTKIDETAAQQKTELDAEKTKRDVANAEVKNKKQERDAALQPYKAREREARKRANDSSLTDAERETARRDAQRIAVDIERIGEGYESSIQSLSEKASMAKEAVEELEKEQKEEMANIKQERQTQYAAKLAGEKKNSAGKYERTGNWITRGSFAFPAIIQTSGENAAASGAIKGSLKKTDDDKRTEKIIDALKEDKK